MTALKSKISPLPPTRIQKRPRLTTQQIGRLGELLVQYELLRNGIESSPMTTDTGVDLVAHSTAQGRPFTIQVKTCLEAKLGGGKGALAVDWWVSNDCPAQWYACVELSAKRIWIFTKDEFTNVAQQHPPNRAHFYICVKPGTRAYEKNGDMHFSKFLFENRVSKLANTTL